MQPKTMIRAMRCDVLLPVFNAESTVRESVSSLLAQSIEDFRIIIVDDGSAEPCRLVLDEIATWDQRIKVVRRQNGGIVSALNTGLEYVEAPVIARFDADDIAAPNRLETQLAYFDAHPGVIATSGAVRHIDAAGNYLQTHHSPDPTEADPNATPSREPYLIHPFLAVRTEAIRKVGGYRFVHHSEDTDLYWRLAELGELVNLPEILGDYRLHAASISGSSTINGRIMAIHSQLAALSSKRRKHGLPDFEFAKESVTEYKSAKLLSNMVALSHKSLFADEKSWFNLAVAGKMLELSAYRPWPLEPDDIDFIRSAWMQFGHTLSPKYRDQLGVLMKRSAAQLLIDRQISSFQKMAPPELLTGTLARAAKKLFLSRR